MRGGGQNQPSYTLQAVRLKLYVYVSGYSAVLPVFSECVSVPRVHSESVCVWPCPQLLYPGAESVRITRTQWNMPCSADSQKRSPTSSAQSEKESMWCVRDRENEIEKIQTPNKSLHNIGLSSLNICNMGAKVYLQGLKLKLNQTFAILPMM